MKLIITAYKVVVPVCDSDDEVLQTMSIKAFDAHVSFSGSPTVEVCI